MSEQELQLQTWKYALGFVDAAVIKCAIELGIADTINDHGGHMTLSELAQTLDCAPSFLFRILRYLVHQGLFDERTRDGETVTGFTLTPIARRLLLIKDRDASMAGFLLLQTSPVVLKPWHFLSGRVRTNGSPAFEAAHGVDVWSYASKDIAHGEHFNNALASVAKTTVRAILHESVGVFEGLSTVVDVGGGNGTAMRMLVEKCPWISAINFDTPHVVEAAPQIQGVQHIGGDMFQSVPKADAAYLMFVLHDWNDEECIKILKNCKDAIDKEKGKVIIVEVVVEEDCSKKHGLSEVGLMLDMLMMAQTREGKERTEAEWKNVLAQAGFNTHTIKPILAAPSVIEAFP
ncbi:hypothetical protein H6P81_017455 [Aristolochia fimbriata]|uniref:Uncharacterized protein n=1 Tax=Aristolochia fimbriata TaxID=158543 RepID=A0AAV7E1A7_ARIFI|nr:hypothetical protein H6P81_017455 [Aristolochia fimbriata]